MASRPNIFNIINDLKSLLEPFQQVVRSRNHLRPLDRFSLFDL